MNLPKKIKVGGLTYKVVFPYTFVERTDVVGQVCHYSCQIRIANRGINGEVRSDQAIWQTFWHEVVHVVDHSYNNGEMGESLIERLAQGLYQVVGEFEV